MAITTTKYVRKPLYVDAVQVTEENFHELAEWCHGLIEGRHIKVRVSNPMSVRQTKAFVGDWLLYTDTGYKIYTDKAFQASFDVAVTPQV
jgi:hypothetical protein